MSRLPENQRPLQSAAFVMLAIAAIDAVIKLIEYLAGDTPLWKMMLGAGIAVLIVDVVLYDRTTLGINARNVAQWLGRGLREGFRTLWLLLKRLLGMNDDKRSRLDSP